MIAITAIGVGVLMTMVAVAIAGLVLEIVLILLHRSLSNSPSPLGNEQAGSPAVLQVDESDNSVRSLQWAERIAA